MSTITAVDMLTQSIILKQAWISVRNEINPGDIYNATSIIYLLLRNSKRDIYMYTGIAQYSGNVIFDWHAHVCMYSIYMY